MFDPPLYVLAPSWALWSARTFQGRIQPVIPCTWAEFIEVRERLSLAGIVPELVPWRSTDPVHLQDPGDGVVWFSDEPVRLAAKAYALLTGRTSRPWPPVSHELRDGASDVYVCLNSAIDGTLVNSLSEFGVDSRTAIGILSGESEARLRINLLVGAAIAGRAIGRAMNRGDLRNELPIELARTSSRTVCGRRASASEVRQFLQNRRAILVISTHSDGLDAKLGRESALCALKTGTTRPSAPSPPSCLLTGHCHRLSKPLQDAIDDSRLISVKSLQCSLLVMDVCHGLPQRQGAFSPQYSLFNAIQAYANVLVAAFHLHLRDGKVGDTDGLWSDLSQGVEIGRAFGNFMASPYARRYLIRFALFGEPTAFLSSEEPRTQLPPPVVPMHGASARPIEEVSTIETSVALLRYLEVAPPNARKAAISDEHAPMFGKVTEELRSTEHLLAALCSSSLAWNALSTIRVRGFSCGELSVASASCQSCGALVQVREVRIRGVGIRKLIRCDECSVESDLPSVTRSNLLHVVSGSVYTSVLVEEGEEVVGIAMYTSKFDKPDCRVVRLGKLERTSQCIYPAPDVRLHGHGAVALAFATRQQFGYTAVKLNFGRGDCAPLQS